MVKSSYRFSGSSFTGQKYTYVGPASNPCRKITGPANIDITSYSGWEIVNNSYKYTGVISGPYVDLDIPLITHSIDPTSPVPPTSKNITVTDYAGFYFATTVLTSDPYRYYVDESFSEEGGWVKIGCSVSVFVEPPYAYSVTFSVADPDYTFEGVSGTTSINVKNNLDTYYTLYFQGNPTLYEICAYGAIDNYPPKASVVPYGGGDPIETKTVEFGGSPVTLSASGGEYWISCYAEYLILFELS